MAEETRTFPAVRPAPDNELAQAVRQVPLVKDVMRVAAWVADGRPVSAGRMPERPDTLGVPHPVLAWVVAVNTRMVAIEPGRAVFGPRFALLQTGDAEFMRFWDEVVMDVLDRCDFGLTGSPEMDQRIPAMLEEMYAGKDVDGGGSPPDELERGLDLLAYCGLIERDHGRARLTPLGLWGMCRELRRMGHTAPSS